MVESRGVPICLAIAEIQIESDSRASSGDAGQVESAANALGALSHINKPIALVRRRISLRNKSFSIVFHRNFDGIATGFGLHPNFMRHGMF
jgi:hypothetical protein